MHLSSTANPLLILHNLKYFEDLLERKDFIHQSSIVSLRKLNTISRKAVSIQATHLPVSDNYKESFFAVVEEHAK